MPRLVLPLAHGRPVMQVVLTLAQGGGKVTRMLLADTGAGSMFSPFDLLLEEADCLLCDGTFVQTVDLGGAYSNAYPIYLLRVEIPSLHFDHHLRAVGVPHVPPDLDGIACFLFLNRFTYGNFGNPLEFALET